MADELTFVCDAPSTRRKLSELVADAAQRTGRPTLTRHHYLQELIDEAHRELEARSCRAAEGEARR